MSSRHLARSIVMQVLFQWDFTNTLTSFVEDDIEYIVREFGVGIDDTHYINETLKNILGKRAIIDEILAKAAPEWPLEKIASVDRNVLRLGLYELVFGDREHIPHKVAINEAIELAKAFGGEKSGKFVNGVLGAVYKEMGEPGKDEVKKPKKTDEEDPSTFPVEKKGGAVVFAKDEFGIVYFAMVLDVFGYWTLSKGTIEAGETVEEGTIREVHEELGLSVRIIEKLGENEYIAHHPQKGKIRKHVAYFLAESPFVPVALHSESGGLKEARWFRFDEIADLTMYEDVTQFMTESINTLIVSQE